MQMHTGPLSGLSDEEEDEADADDETSQERMELGDRMEQWMETGPAGTGCCIHQAPTSLPGLPCLLLLCCVSFSSGSGVCSGSDRGREQTVVSALFRNELFLSSCEYRGKISNFSHMLILIVDDCCRLKLLTDESVL